MRYVYRSLLVLAVLGLAAAWFDSWFFGYTSKLRQIGLLAVLLFGAILFTRAAKRPDTKQN